MIKIKAKLRLNQMRKTSIHTGYRPQFNFISETSTSGHIILLDREKLLPGEEAVVEILFLFKEFLGDDLSPGKIVTFGETPQHCFGDIQVMEIREVED